MKPVRWIAVLILLFDLAACRVRTPQAAGDGPPATLELEPQRVKEVQGDLNPLPFVLKNTSTNEISYMTKWSRPGGTSFGLAGLVTTDSDGKLVPLDSWDELDDPNAFTMFTYEGVVRSSQTLNPGASVSVYVPSYKLPFFRETRGGGKGLRVFGQLPVTIVGTGWMYLVRSAPIEIQPETAKPPGQDAGKTRWPILTVDEGIPQTGEPHGEEPPVTFQAEPEKGTLHEGDGVLIPFVLKNTSTNEISFIAARDPVRLTTTNDSGKPVTLYELQNPNAGPGFSFEGISPHPENLKPGESVEIQGGSDMEMLAYAAWKGRKVFGMLPITIIGSDWMYMAQSSPFDIPPKLTKPPWEDEGKQAYLSVTIDEAKRRLSSPIRGPEMSRCFISASI